MPVAAQIKTVSLNQQSVNTAPTQTTTNTAQAGQVAPKVPFQLASVTKVNFKELADKAAKEQADAVQKNLSPIGQSIHPPLSIPDTDPATLGNSATASTDDEGAPAPAPATTANDTEGGPLVASPTPTTSYQGQDDIAKVGGSFFVIPPDTTGSVGLDKVFTTVNNNYRIHDKTTGAALSTVSVDTFWAPSGGSGFFDPQTQYDPYNNRWVLAIASDGQTSNSAIEIAISQTPDPQGTYYMYRFIVGTATLWADFPMLGFNKTFVAVGMNMFTISGGAFTEGRILTLDYAALRTGLASGTQFTGSTIGFCNHPVTTYDPNEPNLYLAQHLSSGGATYRINTISGTSASGPSLAIGATQTRPGGGWTQPGGDILPQQCTTTPCPATVRFIDAGDAQVRSNPAFRNGKVYYAQTIGLPAGGLTRTAAQWTVVDATTKLVVDGGRVDDPTATSTNGGKWYAYPSVTANRNGDILMGFSQFASNQFPAAGYTYRQASDTAGTMRDPVIYKAGEDYYEKTFGGTRNRWGDYSHTVVDPSNDRDMWTIQEYASTRSPAGCTPNTGVCSRWGTWWAKLTAPAGGNDLLISEFRLRGPNGANDEFVEIYNNSDAPFMVTTTDASAGYSLRASDGNIRFTIPNGTVIPARGHYLGVNSVGYSLASYPAGNGTTATGDATYTTDIPDNAGIALFRSSTSTALADRLDAVGSSSEANTLYKEGTGYPVLTPFSIDYSFYRSNCPNNSGMPLGCLGTDAGLPKDSNVNSADFVFVDTNGTSAGAGQRLGAPGPENLSSPVQKRNGTVAVTNIDPAQSASNPPNRVRDLTSDPSNNSTFGTLAIRRTVTNNTGGNVTRLRFRIIDITTFPAPSGTADLRARTSMPTVVTITGTNPACVGQTCTVQGTTLEEPPTQPNGGAFNSSLSAGTVTLATPLAAGASINVQFLLGIQQTGNFRFFINVEALP